MPRYIKGDIFELLPYGSDAHKYVIHCCNNEGRMARGFVVPLCKKWPEVKTAYTEWSKRANLYLGRNQLVRVEPDVTVVNMIAQDGIYPRMGRPPVRYTALADCMRDLTKNELAPDDEIHAPMFGAGLAGGDWKFIEQLLIECFEDQGISVTIYKLNV